MTLFDRWIFRTFPISQRDLDIFRILYCLYMLFVAMPLAVDVAGGPSYLYVAKPGLAWFFSGFPSMTTVMVVNGLLTFCLCALLTGVGSRFVSFAAAFFALLLSSWHYAGSKTHHDWICLFIPFVMGFTGWKVDEEDEGSWPHALFAWVIGLGYLTAFLSKLATGWLDPRQSSTFGHLAILYNLLDRKTPFAELLLSTSPMLAKPLDWIVLLFEGAAIFTVFRRRAFLIFCAVACVFHLAVAMLFKLHFSWLILTYAGFVAWTELKWPAKLTSFFQRAAAKIESIPKAFRFVVCFTMFFTFILFRGEPSSRLSAIVVLAGAALAPLLLLSANIRYNQVSHDQEDFSFAANQITSAPWYSLRRFRLRGRLRRSA